MLKSVTALLLSAFAGLLGAAAVVTAAEMTDFGEPAMIVVAAPAAVVTEEQDKTVITLENVDRRAGISTSLHKRGARVFDAFPVTELAKAWNSCNAMKEEYKLFHKDGVNSLVMFKAGPLQAKCPLILPSLPL